MYPRPKRLLSRLRLRSKRLLRWLIEPFTIRLIAIIASLLLIIALLYLAMTRPVQRMIDIAVVPDPGTEALLSPGPISTVPDVQGHATIELTGIFDNPSYLTLELAIRPISPATKPRTFPVKVYNRVLRGSYSLGFDGSLLSADRTYSYQLTYGSTGVASRGIITTSRVDLPRSSTVLYNLDTFLAGTGSAIQIIMFFNELRTRRHRPIRKKQKRPRK